MIFWRVIRGEEGVGTAFIICLCIIAAYFAYDVYVPSFSDFFLNWFRCVGLAMFAYSAASMHNSCRATGMAVRLFSRTAAVIFTLIGTYFTYKYFGPYWAMGYVPFVMIAPFLFGE